MDDLFLPAEMEEPEKPKQMDYRPEGEELEKLFRQGIWVDSKLRPHKLPDMPSFYIANVLNKIWVQCEKDALQNVVVSLDEIFLQSGESLDDDYFGDLGDPHTFWEEHPFVPLALAELKKRKFFYEDPSLKSYDDADSIQF